MTNCPSCGAGLDTPLGCEACGVLLSPDEEPTPFEVLGLPLSFEVDAKALKKTLLRLSRRMHPDFFGTADDAQRELAERNSAALNAAYDTVSDPFRRADWMVRVLGGPSEKDERQMPQVFLMEVLEWNETLEAARDAAPGSGERAALDDLEKALQTERGDVLGAIGQALTPTPEENDPSLGEVRKKLNAVRYIDRTLGEIRGLRLAQAASD